MPKFVTAKLKGWSYTKNVLFLTSESPSWGGVIYYYSATSGYALSKKCCLTRLEKIVGSNQSNAQK
jgi:hypothetical protein